MKTTTATVTSKGQVTLPAALRRSLNLKAGDKVTFERDTQGRVIMAARTGTLADLRGIIKFDRPISDKELEGWIAEARGRKLKQRLGDDGE